MTPQERYELIQEAMQAFNPFYRHAVGEVFAAYDIQGRDWFYAYLARGLEPQSLTVDILQQMTPYTQRAAQAAWLREAADHGVLQAAGADGYRLTDDGRAAVAAFFTAAHQAIAPLEPLSEEKMARLAELLARIVSASATGAALALKTQLRISRHTDPGASAVPAVRIDQYLTDLLRLREDAHLAAWIGLGVDGRTWDALTAVWRNEQVSAASLAETLANRQFSTQDYAASLAKLQELGWIEGEDGAYTLSAHGRQIREEAEAATNRLYFGGWSALSADETAELDELLAALRDSLREMAADKATAANSRANDLAGELSTAIFNVSRPAMDPLIDEMDLAKPGLAWGLIQAASFQPEPVSVARVRRRTPYAAPELWQGRFAQLAAQDLLASGGSDGYRLTAAGEAAFTRLIATFHAYLATVQVDVDLAKLADLLGRVVNACLVAPEPPGIWCIRHSHRIAPDEDASALAKIDQHLDDLNAFRDDAHLASFASYDVSGQAWELLTQIWRDEAHTAAEMAGKTPLRGYDEAAYATALDELMALGWVFVDRGGSAQLTAAGKSVRETAETATDRYFFLPWLVLSEGESAELQTLMEAAKEELEQLAQVEPSPA